MTKYYDGGLATASPRHIVVGIDQSYSGFSLTALSCKGDVEYATWVYKAPHSGIYRLVNIRDFLEAKLDEVQDWGHQMSDTCMEGYAYSSQMAHMAGELGGMVKTVLYEKVRGDGMFPLIVPPTSLKKYVTGKGTGVAKSQMLLSVYKKWGVEFDDDNAADSFSLAMVVSGRADAAYEKEIVQKLRTSGKFRDSFPVRS